MNRARSFNKRRNRRREANGLDPADLYLETMADPYSDLARECDREHDDHVVRKRLARVQPEFSPRVWGMFWRVAVDGLPASRVAEELGTSENAVLCVKSRVVRRLREEADDLVR